MFFLTFLFDLRSTSGQNGSSKKKDKSRSKKDKAKEKQSKGKSKAKAKAPGSGKGKSKDKKDKDKKDKDKDKDKDKKKEKDDKNDDGKKAKKPSSHPEGVVGVRIKRTGHNGGTYESSEHSGSCLLSLNDGSNINDDAIILGMDTHDGTFALVHKGKNMQKVVVEPDDLDTSRPPSFRMRVVHKADQGW